MSKVLLVDDDPEILWDMKILLGRRGYEVVAYSDGTSAVAAVRSGELYDIGLIDQMLLDMHGNEAIRQLREMRPDAPLIAMSSHDFESPLADDFIPKERPMAEFYRILEKHLEKRKQSSSV